LLCGDQGKNTWWEKFQPHLTELLTLFLSENMCKFGIIAQKCVADFFGGKLFLPLSSFPPACDLLIF